MTGSTADVARANISILILTRDEEANLPRCLASVAWSDDIVVVDSFSRDGTVGIAKAAGARVLEHAFDDFSSQQNWAMENASFRHDWIYHIDADEVVPPDLRDELIAVSASSPDSIAGYRLRYRNYFLGRWIRHCGIYPVWSLRFFRQGRIRWERSVHQVSHLNGGEGSLRAHFEHYSFNKGLEAWFEKHNRYSTCEAIEAIADLRQSAPTLRDFVSNDPVRRRAALKRLSFRLPCRPLARFLYMYLYRGGFLDGSAGFTYCRLLAIYEYMIVLKMHELRRRERGLST